MTGNVELNASAKKDVPNNYNCVVAFFWLDDNIKHDSRQFIVRYFYRGLTKYFETVPMKTVDRHLGGNSYQNSLNWKIIYEH